LHLFLVGANNSQASFQSLKPQPIGSKAPENGETGKVTTVIACTSSTYCLAKTAVLQLDDTPQ